MLTKWAKKLIGISTDNSVMFFNGALGCIECKGINGTDYITGPESFAGTLTFVTNPVATGSSPSQGIAIGGGNTPATENDYSIESIITSLTCGSLSVDKSYDSENGKMYYFVNLTLTNPTAEDITVNEVCRLARYHKVTNFGDAVPTSGNTGICVLMDRTVLDTPLLVPAGESAILRYRVGYDVDKPEV